MACDAVLTLFSDVTVAETCPREQCLMPLARSRESGEVKCPSCGLQVRHQAPAVVNEVEASASNDAAHEDYDMEEVMEDGMRDSAEQAEPQTERNIGTARQETEKEDQAVKRLGDRLLTGWTMLAEACGRCKTPLVKRGDTVECVGCLGDDSANAEQPREVLPHVSHQKPEEPNMARVDGRVVAPRVNTSQRRSRGVSSVDALLATRQHLLDSLSALTCRLEQADGVTSKGDTCYALAECAKAIEAVERALTTLRELNNS